MGGVRPSPLSKAKDTLQRTAKTENIVKVT